MRSLLITLGLLLVANAQTQPFLDTVGHPHAQFIEVLREKGIVQGYGYGIFRPDILINRAEFLKITMLAVFGDEVFDTDDRRCFADFIGDEQWYWVYACTAKDRGIIHGYPDGTFRGEQPVNFVEALKISIEAWKIPMPSYLEPPAHWYDPYMDIAATRQVFSYFLSNPAHSLTRSDMAALIVSLEEPIMHVTLPETEEEEEEPLPTLIVPGICGNGILESYEECDDGNLLDGDGCSSICVIVPEPIRHGAMRIEQRPTGAVGEAGGAMGVGLLAFDAIAGRQDVYITGVKFKAATGSLNNAESYRMYVDMDYDGSVETFVSNAVPQNDILSFSSIVIPIEDGRYRRVEVRADMRESTTPSVIGIAFETDDPEYVQAVDVIDGRDLTGITTDDEQCLVYSTCWIEVHTQSSPRIITIAERGNLYVTENSVPVPSHQLLGGTTSDVLLRLGFFADGEDIEIKKIRIDGGSSSIDYLEFYEEGASTPFDTARIAGCESTSTSLFCADTSFVIPRDQDKDVLVHAVINTDSDGATSGDTVALSLTASTTSPVAVDAFGLSSSQDLSQNDGDSTAEGEIFIGLGSPGANSAITGSTHDIVLAKILSISNANTDPDDTSVPVSTSAFGKFRFTAAAHNNSFNGLNKVVIDELVFTVNATNVVVDSASFELFNVQDASVTTSCSGSATTGNITVTCSSLESSSVSTVIPQGSFIDLALQVDITNPQSDGSSTLQASLNLLGDRTTTGTVEWSDEDTSFGWVDIGETQVRSTRYRMQ